MIVITIFEQNGCKRVIRATNALLEGAKPTLAERIEGLAFDHDWRPLNITALHDERKIYSRSWKGPQQEREASVPATVDGKNARQLRRIHKHEKFTSYGNTTGKINHNREKHETQAA